MPAVALDAHVGRAFYGNFAELRNAQREVIEPAVAGQDALVLAGTGSGKTEAVLAPLVQRWLPAMRAGTGCTLIYVTPTRALANDLLRRIEPPLRQLGLDVGVRHGDRNDVGRGRSPALLITTPESLDVLVMTRAEPLRAARAVVLDEIHLTYNTQRGFQTASLLRRLEDFSGNSLQVVGLSATVASSEDIWQFFRPGRAVVAVRDDQPKPLDVLIRHVPSDQALIDLVGKIATGTGIKVLVFANTRRECDRLGAVLRWHAGFGQSVFVHHSALEREARLSVERSFQEAVRAVCIATSTLELGIDIGDIDLVVLYGHPGGWESFLQRVGRGNRRSDKTNVLCLTTPDHGPSFRGALAFEALLSQIRSGRLERERPLEIYGAAVQQLLSLVAEGNGRYLRIRDLGDAFATWSHLDVGVVEALLQRLTESGYLVRHDFKYRVGAGEQLHRLRDLRLIWGNFPVRSRDVELTTAGRQIGRIPAGNLARLSPGIVVRFAGRHWRVRQVRPEGVDVEPTGSTAGIDVTYGGSRGGTDPTIVEEMLRLVQEGVGATSLGGGAGLDFLASVERMRPHFTPDRMPVARDSHGHYHHFTFGGGLVNEVIARWAGLDDYYAGEIALRARRCLDMSNLPDLGALSEVAAVVTQPGDLTLFQNLLPPMMLRRELTDLWLKTGVYQRSINRLRRSHPNAVPLRDLAPLLE